MGRRWEKAWEWFTVNDFVLLLRVSFHSIYNAFDKRDTLRLDASSDPEKSKTNQILFMIYVYEMHLESHGIGLS